jgi:hypothetical protein
MSEKLTRERVYDYVVGKDVSGLCALIESDREAVRAETREELLKDHFKQCEVLEGRTFDSRPWRKMKMVLVPDGNYGFVPHVRRPAKKRQMTREEKVKKLREHFSNKHAWLPDELKDATLDDLCQAFEIPTEVDE